MQRRANLPRRLRRVTPRRVLDRGELGAALHLQHRDRVRQREHVEDERLQLDAGVLRRVHRLARGWVRKGDLLLGEVEDDRQVVRVALGLQEGACVEVDADVARAEHQAPVVAHALRGLGTDLRVLHHRWLALPQRDHADLLVGRRLVASLRAKLSALGHAVADEDRVRHWRDGIIHAVRVQKVDPELGHVRECARDVQCAVDPAVAVWSPRHSARALQDDLALVGQARKSALLEEEDMLVGKSVEGVGLEALHGVGVRHRRRHHVPGQRHRVRRSARQLRSALLGALDALRLQLEEALARWQLDVEHALRLVEAEPCALSAGQQDQTDLTTCDCGQGEAFPLCQRVRSRGRLGRDLREGC
mmetsp:Transcript_27428/g.88150  ORF Transcript_27428/g.88150 Transcript_27428/m.88150 type:complete len:361 (+) Transcript_27428:686-1768(+)